MPHIKLRGISYFFEDQNTDQEEVVVMVHGHPFNHSMWNYQLEALKKFRTIVPDLRGYGNTENQFEKIFIEEHALDIVFLLDHLLINKVHLIGLSMGGQIIVEFVRLFPERVKSLVFCASSPRSENDLSYKVRLQKAEEIANIGMLQHTKETICQYVHPHTLKSQTEVFDHLFSMMSNTSAAGAIAAHRGRAERRDNEAFMKSILIPILLIVGQDDFFTSVDEMKSLAAAMKNGNLVIIEKAGHMPNMEQAEAFNSAMQSFYNDQFAANL